MDNLDDLLRELRSFDSNAEEIAVHTARLFEAEILDMNTEDQLFSRGEDSKGASLGKYAPLTISIKKGLGQPTNRVTLKDTGDFHRSFFARFVGKYITIGATDSKAYKLETKYSKDIFGLSDNNVQELITMLKPEMINEFRRIILR